MRKTAPRVRSIVGLAGGLTVGLAAVIGLGLVPLAGNDYLTSLAINLLMFACLATAWGLFCGTTGHVSLATVAFFGIGAYSVAILAERLPWLLVLGIAALIGGLFALLVGLVTLRLAGSYFVIFTFGLTELVRQLVNWYEGRIAGSIGRYVFVDVTPAGICWQLLALFIALLLFGAWLSRSRLGFALRLIGEDETAARHCGVATTRVKLVVFTVTSVAMVLVGAIIAPRWTYLDAAIAFNPVISFEVVIMALLGGAARFWGPALGVLPLVLLFEVLTRSFPNHFPIVLGLVFLVIVYVLPRGLTGLIARPGAGAGAADAADHQS